MILETGKLDSELLKKIVFEKITYRNDQVKIRPGIGEAPVKAYRRHSRNGFRRI